MLHHAVQRTSRKPSSRGSFAIMAHCHSELSDLAVLAVH